MSGKSAIEWTDATWNSREEAIKQEIFCSDEQGSRVECHYVSQQICEMLGIGNPGRSFTGRGFRGHAYAVALSEWVLAQEEQKQ